MNFLEASQILAKFKGGPSLRIRLAASANVDPLLHYIGAYAALNERTAEVTTLPFGTLGQALLSRPSPGEQEVILLMPWDLVPECDWRSGIPLNVSSPDILLEAAQDIAWQLSQRECKLLYLPAPIPPLYTDPIACGSLSASLAGIAAGLGAHFLNPHCFALGNYLASGVPVKGASISEVAQAVVDLSHKLAEGSFKVLITDLDNVLWAGLAAEDGEEGIKCNSEGIGFRHFLYQGLLAKLQASGVLLAAVSRNDLDVARAPILAGKTLLAESNFVEILASYEPKSIHIRRLAESLNLGLDSFVFVDDNPIELAEVSAALSQVKCLQFPVHDEELVKFLRELSILFARRTISNEDKQRTQMYRRRLEGNKLSLVKGEGANLTGFLTKLQMELTIYDRSVGDHERAIQLINKTNQFNLNGNRMSDDEVAQVLSVGGRLYTAKLDDRTGSHGEILVCLLDQSDRIISFVLSCRVFQRQVENVFMCWLIKRFSNQIKLTYMATMRNTPMSEFLKDTAFVLNDEGAILDGIQFLENHEAKLNLFKLKEVGFD
jgi:FkbH-like protein